ncbi:Hypothetical protein R9X50_00771100 [Acrodontium crateriforme]|uniref:Carbohydrate kinase PfkB domain-containing protein n=1 Tax=Acrodontium crateriforme TaxID=150365 RepID=A0AAQ3RAY8_9PEZI|nr:Hypothetical protein R9X50_00771100 [Acrodontium crateriforme]
MAATQLPWACRSCRTAIVRRYVFQRQKIASRTISTNSRFFQVSEEVSQAIAERRPVVALESTIYTHGFPYPDNLALASRLESLVRINGGVPATIAILDGVARVGLGADELVRLVSSPGALKISRRDFGFALGQTNPDGKRWNGGTTISGTMILAHLAGIRIFATGGLGGVHRGAEQTMDVSADLTELGRTPVTVISSGCKSFLDLPKTLEYLETQGVGVAAFADGRTGPIDMPGFYTRESGVRAPKVIQDEAEAARIIHSHLSLGLTSGLHFANPIPEEFSLPLPKMEAAITQALQEARAAGAKGAAETPFVLNKIKEITGSTSVAANRALVEANVIRGTKIAVELQKLEADQIVNRSPPGARIVNHNSAPIEKNPSKIDIPAPGQHQVSNTKPSHNANIFVAGSLAVDLSCDYIPQSQNQTHTPTQRTSNPSIIRQSLGGVGHNVARAATLVGANVRLCSAVGDDLSGKAAMDALAANGISDAGIHILPARTGSRTAQYVAVNDANKDLVLAMADMSILEQTASRSGQPSAIDEAFDSSWYPQMQESRPSHLVVDANWSSNTLARWLSAASLINAHVTFEPVSDAKSTRIFNLPPTTPLSIFPNALIHLATPNASEITALYQAARNSSALEREDWWLTIDAFGLPSSGSRTKLALATSPALVDQGIPQQCLQLLPFLPSICAKLGPAGVLVTQLLAANDPRLQSAVHGPHILSRNPAEIPEGVDAATVVGGVYMRLFPATEVVPKGEIVSVNGIGDTFAGTLVTALAAAKARGVNAGVEDFIDIAQQAAVLSLKSDQAVSPQLAKLKLY